LTGLERLEYRGYDSAGVAIKDGNGITLTRRVGEVAALVEAVGENVVDGTVGLGHTRWATHGGVSESNAHPHVSCDGRVTVVHNGIIDNYASLKEELEAEGHVFRSETDTEVVPHLIESGLDSGLSASEAFRAAIGRLSGTYAIAAIVDSEDAVFATRNGSPLVFGLGEDQYFLASDVPAFIEYTRDVVYLHDGDYVEIRPDGYELTDVSGAPVDRGVERVDWDVENASMAGFDHFMAKEIHEQPEALRRTIQGRLDSLSGAVDLEEFSEGTFADVGQVQFVAMGTSHHAAMYAATLLRARGVAANAYMAGEYAAVRPPVTDDTLVVAVTQSGETADTLEAIRRAHDAGAQTLALTNVVASTVTRECDQVLYIRAGPEIGVAATKTFSSQVTALAMLAERIAGDVGAVRSADSRYLVESLSRLPSHVQEVLDTSPAAAIAALYDNSDSYFFIGREVAHPVALEGALKFKEISYEHAEGFAASELKHGPLALVTPMTPVFAVFTGRDDELTLSSMKEVQARGAPVVAITSDTDGDISEFADHVLPVPDTHPDVAGILANVQLQLVAYHAARLLDRPIDKPRNLAKSVTVH
jgi:glucosamine--fructose-6-phosphate aminotransferase (isomerizing)